MKVQKKINISLNGHDLPMPVRVVATDKAIQLVLRYIDFTIPDGTTATLFVKKPSGKFVYQTEDIAISGNTVTIDLYNQAIAERGKAYFTVTLENGEDTISTFENYFDVEKNYKDSSAEESKTVITGFEEMLEEFRAAVKDNVTAEALVQAVEEYLLEHPITGGTVSDEQIANAVEAYLLKYPITGVSSEQIAQAVSDYMEENPVECEVSKEEFRQLSDTVNNKVTNPTSGMVGQILEIETVDENGKPKTYKAVNKPQDGYTPQKGVDYFDGQNGKDGTSATHSWNGTTLTVTSASGTSSADLKGDKGDNGYTPVKGTDYFTEADKQELVEEVLEEIDIPSGGGVSNEQIKNAVNEYLDANPPSGLTNKEKETILALFKSIEYTNNMSSTIKRLEALFAGEEGIKYTITYNLTNVTSSDSETSIVEGSAKTITLTADEGFLLESVIVTMNGIDITSSVYADGVITIASVTGDIVINAIAVNASILQPVYTLAEETVFDGSNFVDTNYKLFDKDKDWSLVTEFSGTEGIVFSEDVIDGVGDTSHFAVRKFSGWFWRPELYSHVPTNANCYTGNVNNVKYVFTKEAGSAVITMYSVIDGAKIIDNGMNAKIYLNKSEANAIYGKTNTLKLGVSYAADTLFLKGTIHDFKIYERILETTEINEYLGV